jgi:uncharacterized RDD family membrane protein YckC
MAGPSEQLDTSIEIVTPENIAFRYRVAGPFRRLPAYLIDLLIRWVIAVAGLIVLGVVFGIGGVPGLGIGLSFVLWFLLAWFYGGVFETYFNGQTPGKRLLRIRVVTIEGHPIGGLQAVLRNILRIVDAQPVFSYLVGLGAAALNDRFQRLGDIVCGTMVVVEERQWLQGVLRVSEPEVARMLPLIPPAFQPSRTLARALAAYVGRRRNFSWARRQEIARHLAEPLRRKFDLPAGTNFDLLLCALYHRTFITDREEQPTEIGSPFLQPQSPFVRFENITSAMAAMDQR